MDGATRICSDRCRDIRKRQSSGMVTTRHAALIRVLKSEQVPLADRLYSLNFYEALLLDGCAYCKGPLSTSGHALDRIENSKGHRCFNVAACCGFCNGIKGDRLTWDEMMILAPGLEEIREKREIMKNHK